MNTMTKITLSTIVVQIVALLASATFFGAIILVAVHFVKKFW